MTNIDEFNINDCAKTDANCINAYVDFHLDPDNETGLCLDTSWGGECLDLEGIVKAGETVTTLHLSPEEDPNCLEYEREDGQSDCIHGDDLSRIISMKYLKDVDQTTPPVSGDVYMYDGDIFKTFNLQQYMDDLDIIVGNLRAAITSLTNRVTNLENRMSSAETRLTNIENTLNPIANRFEIYNNVPSNAKIMLGNINLYSDTNAVINSAGAATSLDKSHGIYGHSLSTDIAQDEIFG